MKHFGVIGNPVTHSFSPAYFAQKFKALGIADSYTAFELQDLAQLSTVIRENYLTGFNVTMPFKQKVIHHLQSISDDAVKVNAVNTVKIIDDQWIGYNTDLHGFRNSLTPLLHSHHTNALVFGTGGSSAAVKFVLRELGIAFKSVSRGEFGDLVYSDVSAAIIEEHTLLINTTPLGMKHRIHEAVDIPYEAISNLHLCYDLIYSPEETVFLRKAADRNATVKNGLEMLKLQADKAWEIWNM